MEIDTLNAMNEGMYLSLLMVIKVIALITALFAIAGFTIYITGFAWFCFEEKRRSVAAPRMARRTSPPSAWESAPRVPNTQVRTTFIHKEINMINTAS
jgi:hypothetical protein